MHAQPREGGAPQRSEQEDERKRRRQQREHEARLERRAEYAAHRHADADQMTRFGVMKHLKVLEEAGLVVTRRRGREKLHFLNPVPIRQVHDRWVSKFSEPWAAGLGELKRNLEKE